MSVVERSLGKAPHHRLVPVRFQPQVAEVLHRTSRAQLIVAAERRLILWLPACQPRVQRRLRGKHTPVKAFRQRYN